VTWNGHRANRTEITALFRVALVIFVVTVVIGIANGILIGIAVSLIRLGAREGPALRVAQAVR